MTTEKDFDLCKERRILLSSSMCPEQLISHRFTGVLTWMSIMHIRYIFQETIFSDRQHYSIQKALICVENDFINPVYSEQLWNDVRNCSRWSWVICSLRAIVKPTRFSREVSFQGHIHFCLIPNWRQKRIFLGRRPYLQDIIHCASRLLSNPKS